jgi:hypothetical protein
MKNLQRQNSGETSVHEWCIRTVPECCIQTGGYDSDGFSVVEVMDCFFVPVVAEYPCGVFFWRGRGMFLCARLSCRRAELDMNNGWVTWTIGGWEGINIYYVLTI